MFALFILWFWLSNNLAIEDHSKQLEPIQFFRRPSTGVLRLILRLDGDDLVAGGHCLADINVLRFALQL